ncbi:hypothetical protein GS896_25565 [Rhodococcus hoagii]|nr:hypothetical protein [Prescottella equi]MBM4654126.1 hypothetical protein [Prescottella equi]MBM4717740.1 hypothetical protein [Prescottella equi]MBM4719601.1 hypothetical protein [Prescottella equi]NKR23399.1 hypothetical protein [Prescottella equi]
MGDEPMTLARAVGETPAGSPAFHAGTDFDPRDPEQVEIIEDATARHGAEARARTDEENTTLRARIVELEAERAGLSVTDYLAEIDHADDVRERLDN